MQSFRGDRSKAILAALLLVALTVPTWAQTVVPPVVSDRFGPPARATTAPAASSIASVLDSDIPLLRSGPFAFRPQFMYRAMHSSGLEVSPGQREDTTAQTVAPGLIIEAGDHWRLDYEPSWTYYSNHAFQDTSDQLLNGSGFYEGQETALTVSGLYASAHPVLVETAQQTHEVTYRTDVNIRRAIGMHSRFDVAGYYSQRDASVVAALPSWVPSNTKEWGVGAAYWYKYSERTSVGVGALLGEANPSVGSGMTVIRPELHLVWSPTDHITINAETGYEDRRVRGRGNGQLRAPIYLMSMRYSPFATTTLVLDGSRGMALSYFADHVTKSYSWGVGLEQRLFGVLYATVGARQQSTRFVPTGNVVAPSRKDDYMMYNARLSLPVSRRGAVGVFYQRSENDSRLAAYEFTTNKYGLEVSVRF